MKIELLFQTSKWFQKTKGEKEYHKTMAISGTHN